MMTEEDAKTKWCPFVRHSADGQATFNRGDTDPLNNIAGPEVRNHDAWLCNCIASSCMAWRWVFVHDGTFNQTMEGPHLEVTKRVPNFVRSDRGYCGMAGRPE